MKNWPWSVSLNSGELSGLIKWLERKELPTCGVQALFQAADEYEGVAVLAPRCPDRFPDRILKPDTRPYVPARDITNSRLKGSFTGVSG